MVDAREWGKSEMGSCSIGIKISYAGGSVMEICCIT